MSKGSGKSSDYGRPACLYNGMIHPLIESPIKGVIWYQGEANSGTSEKSTLYEHLFPQVIKSWRKAWKNNFPFYFVQLPSFKDVQVEPTDSSNWVLLTNSQTKTLSLENTGISVAIDLGEEKDIHPKNKKPVGDRLAYQALDKTYHKKIVSDGPTYKSLEVNKNKITLTFENI
jgi:sialate O-acetylesterase